MLSMGFQPVSQQADEFFAMAELSAKLLAAG
jgi:hypothetical protein